MAYEIKQALCSCCHRCRTECPRKAIRFKNAKYWIDPEKCISCGMCMKVCHNGCISNPEEVVKPEKPHERICKEADICVIGGGAAGLVSAVKAADLGRKVIVLEKMHEVGGSSWYAGGFTLQWSKQHAVLGAEDKRKEMYEEFLKKVDYNVDEELLKRMFQANEAFNDWLFDAHGLGDDYDLALKFMTPAGPIYGLEPKYVWPDAGKRIDRMIGPGEIGSYMALKMQDELQKEGGEILLNTSAKELLLGEQGQIRGVLAEDAGGEIEIKAKAVIVATGCFSRNKELMNRFQPLFYEDDGKEPIHIFSGAGSTGDGILMCDAIGADIDYKNKRVNMFGPMRHPYPCASMNICLSQDGFAIGSDGKRMGSQLQDHEVSPLVNDPKRMCYKIIDDRMAEIAIEEGRKEPPQSPGMDFNPFLERWREVLNEEAEDGAVVIADSIEELAEKLGVDSELLGRYVDDYNEETKKPGELPTGIPDFMKPKHAPIPIEKSPFYAFKLKLFHENAIGGMTIDKNTSVLKNGTPIPGLYAAGDTTRGIMISGDVGVGYIERIFSALTQAYNEGYIAGEEAANYTNS